VERALGSLIGRCLQGGSRPLGQSRGADPLFAELVGTGTGTETERAIWRLIALMVLCHHPLAITLAAVFRHGDQLPPEATLVRSTFDAACNVSTRFVCSS
jgi:hypothetical protein